MRTVNRKARIAFLVSFVVKTIFAQISADSARKKLSFDAAVREACMSQSASRLPQIREQSLFRHSSSNSQWRNILVRRSSSTVS